MTEFDPWPGESDMSIAKSDLAGRAPVSLRPLVELAFNYRWSWMSGAAELFEMVDPHRWGPCGQNPIRLLGEASGHAMNAAASNAALVTKAQARADELHRELGRTAAAGRLTRSSPLAFLCAEFGVHASLPIYAGGLGVLAGDMLKEASDQALPAVGLGLFYRDGYFRQRVDTSGQQHEFWTSTDPERLPAALVSDPAGMPLTVTIRLRGRDVKVQAWRVDVGRVPLYLLDTGLPENTPIDRWITARLYVGGRSARLAQYAVLGIAGIRMMHAMGINPGVIHLNEGHAAFAALEQLREGVAAGLGLDAALEATRARTVFTTHTPVAAGNESYGTDEVKQALGEIIGDVDKDADRVLALGRIGSRQGEQGFGLTPFAIRASRSTNGVSRRHGEVTRAMWVHLFPGTPVPDVPIGHITNGVHLPTWMSPPVLGLMDKYLPAGWRDHAAEAETWNNVESIPDAELWAVMSGLRQRLVDYVRDHSVADRLSRGEPQERIEAAALTLNADTLTVVFARRIATYKRLHLLVRDLSRALALLADAHPIQFVIAGKAHPQDEDAKRILRDLFGLKQAPNVSARVVFLEDYDMAMARVLVAGSDVWANLPRPPQEASGTSGMKAALNGALNLSVLDGWWSEAFDGTNGWGIGSPESNDMSWQDDQDSAALYDLLEREVRPMFYERDASGVPVRWIATVKASIRTIGPRYCATRMVKEYASSVWS